MVLIIIIYTSIKLLSNHQIKTQIKKETNVNNFENDGQNGKDKIKELKLKI